MVNAEKMRDEDKQKAKQQKGNASIYELLINRIQCNNDIIHHNTNNTM